MAILPMIGIFAANLLNNPGVGLAAGGATGGVIGGIPDRASTGGAIDDAGTSAEGGAETSGGFGASSFSSPIIKSS